MKVDYNPYEGREVTGVAETVLSRGRVIVEGGRFVGRAGAGRFLKRAASAWCPPSGGPFVDARSARLQAGRDRRGIA